MYRLFAAVLASHDIFSTSECPTPLQNCTCFIHGAMAPKCKPSNVPTALRFANITYADGTLSKSDILDVEVLCDRGHAPLVTKKNETNFSPLMLDRG